MAKKRSALHPALPVMRGRKCDSNECGNKLRVYN